MPRNSPSLMLEQRLVSGRGAKGRQQRMPADLVQAPALNAQALVQARITRQFDAQAAVQRALLEAFVHYRAPQA